MVDDLKRQELPSVSPTFVNPLLSSPWERHRQRQNADAEVSPFESPLSIVGRTSSPDREGIAKNAVDTGGRPRPTDYFQGCISRVRDGCICWISPVGLRYVSIARRPSVWPLDRQARGLHKRAGRHASSGVVPFDSIIIIVLRDRDEKRNIRKYARVHAGRKDNKAICDAPGGTFLNGVQSGLTSSAERDARWYRYADERRRGKSFFNANLWG